MTIICIMDLVPFSPHFTVSRLETIVTWQFRQFCNIKIEGYPIFIDINIKKYVWFLDICYWFSRSVTPLKLTILLLIVFTMIPYHILNIQILTSDYFSAKSKLHREHLKVNKNICKLNCNTVKLFKQITKPRV